MEGLGSLLFFAILFFFLMRYGCGAHMMHGHGSHGDSHGSGKEMKYIDPVCGMEVEAEKGYGMMHEGTLYRFCTRSCLDKFDADPEQYLHKTQGEKHEM